VTQNPPPTEWFIYVYCTAHTTYNIKRDEKRSRVAGEDENRKSSGERERERELRETGRWLQCRQGALGFKSSETLKTATVVTLRLLVLQAK
jgi:hypothetical protein